VKTTILFGAGAARDFYSPALTTESLTDALTSEESWKRAMKRHEDLRMGANRIEPGELLVALRDIQQVFSDANFEDLVALLDRVSALEHTGFSSASGRSVMNALLRFYKVEHRFRDTVWFDVPFLARQLLAEAVLKSDRHPDYQVMCERQAALLESLLRLGPANLFSLNHDESLVDSVAGLPFEGGFRDERFDVQVFLSAPSTVSYPHGHVRFIPINDSVLMASDGRSAGERRWAGMGPGGGVSTRDENSFDESYDSFLVTGRLKDLALNRNPYAAYYQRLAVDLYSADCLVIVGYSFGDAHLNRFIRNFADQDPGTRQVLIIERDEHPIDMKDWAPGTKLFWILENTKAGGKRSLHFRGTWEDREYEYQSSIDELNARGFGMLYPGITYEKRGYRVFLEGFDTVLATVPGLA
jgi:SIR2-like domain